MMKTVEFKIQERFKGLFPLEVTTSIKVQQQQFTLHARAYFNSSNGGTKVPPLSGFVPPLKCVLPPTFCGGLSLNQ